MFLDRFRSKKRIRYSFIIAVSSISLTLVLCYLIWILKGCRPFMPFISALDIYQPEGTIFSIGLTITGLFVMIFAYDIFYIKHKQITKYGLSNKWRVINLISFPAAAVACVSVIALAHTNFVEYFDLHMIYANLIFYLGAIWCSLLTLISWRLSKENSNLHKSYNKRLIATIISVISLIGMVYFVGVASFEMTNFSAGEMIDRASDEAKFCATNANIYWAYAAVFEWILCVGIIIVILTFWTEIKQHTSEEEE